MKTKILLLLVFALSLFVISCVPARQFQDEKARREKIEAELASLRADFDKMAATNSELNGKIDFMTKQINALERDTTITGISLRKMTTQYDKVSALYDEVNRKYEDLLRLNETETHKINTELQLTQEQLAAKQAQLEKLEAELNNRKQNLDKLQADLLIKEKRIMELESIINKKDSVMRELRNKLTVALKGFENNGLSIIEKDGKIYVSMDETLLFASGSWTVNAKGKDALQKLSTVLANNPDIYIMVEGHTDNVPFKGNGQVKDNWDLSVMRATSVTKIILENKSIDPKRITSAGRGEYIPIDASNNSEARQKNRRTEIILTPNMDEFMRILNNQ